MNGVIEGFECFVLSSMLSEREGDEVDVVFLYILIL
jgi:hypothetical protein